MMTQQDSPEGRMDYILKSKTHAAVFLGRSAEHLKYEIKQDLPRDYHDHKAEQLFKALFDLLVAEAFIDSWFADLGIEGCYEEDSSIGGIPCLTKSET